MPDALTQAIEPLSLEESEQLAVCESEISEGLATFWTVGAALAQISEKRLYRDKFETFQIYCKERWSITRQHAYRLIEAVDVFENVSPVGDIRSERQARAIKHFEKEMQATVWQIAEKTAPIVDGKPKVSAGHLQAVAEVMNGILLAGGLDDGSGEIKPIGTLIDAAVTEEVYERLQRQKEIVRQKMSQNGAQSLLNAFAADSSNPAPSQATASENAKAAPPDVKARLLLRVLETWIIGEDKERADRNTAMHPAKFAVYHFTKTLLGQEKHEETEMRVLGVPRIDGCDVCGATETQVADWIFTNSSTQRLSSAKLALCGGCAESYTALAETAQGVGA